MRLARERFAKGVYGYTTPQFATEPASFSLLALRGRLERPIEQLPSGAHELSTPRPFLASGGSRQWSRRMGNGRCREHAGRAVSGNRALRSGTHALLDAGPQEAHWLYRLKF